MPVREDMVHTVLVRVDLDIVRLYMLDMPLVLFDCLHVQCHTVRMRSVQLQVVDIRRNMGYMQSDH